MNTTKTQHTPGPWDYGTEGYLPEFAKDADLINAGNIVVASIKLYCDNAEREANARLIAAAPELLNALTRFIDFAKAGCNTDWHAEAAQPIFYEMLRAIGKAEGKE